ncbi:MAG: amino acid permease, partial [Armatimonadota bacterium]
MMATEESAAAAAPHTDLSRDLGLFDVTMVGVAGMIGAGIFVLTGLAANEAGPALIIAFAGNGIITLLTGMVYAELGGAIPEAGGGYLWVKEGLPGWNAFIAGWMSWFAHAVAGSLYAQGFAHYSLLALRDAGLYIDGELMGFPVETILLKSIIIIIGIVFVYINYRGASETGLAGNIVTMGKMLIIWMFVIFGLGAILGDPSRMAQYTTSAINPGGFAPNGISGVLTAMGLTFIAFEGYEIIAQAGEEVDNPRTAMGKAVFLAVAAVVVTYVAVAFTAVGAPSPETAMANWEWLGTVNPEVALANAARDFMPLGSWLITIGALLSTMSALNATTYSSTRVAFAMGRDRNLPDSFGAVHPKTRVPHIALLVSGVFIIGMALAFDVHQVAAGCDMMFLLLFLQVNLAGITLRKKYGDKLKFGYVTPFFPWIHIAGIVTKLALQRCSAGPGRPGRFLRSRPHR